MFNILVVEDDANLQKLMRTVLVKNGYNTFGANDGSVALNILDHEHIDLIVSDIMMPNMDGYELADAIRSSNYNLPILMVTAKNQFRDKKKGFSVGIDDYMVKPIDVNELVLRVGAILRRAQISNEHKLVVGTTTLDYDALSVVRNSETILLPQKEFYLLFKLLSYPAKIFTRQQLMDEFWGMDSESEERTVDVHVNRLREKLRDNEDFEIVTVRGLGYKVVKNRD